MKKRKHKHYPDGFVDWMSGYCEGFDDLSDGAWQAACENGVDAYNKEYGTRIDTHDGWMYWLSKTLQGTP